MVHGRAIEAMSAFLPRTWTSRWMESFSSSPESSGLSTKTPIDPVSVEGSATIRSAPTATR